ncbi:hypothetical protein RCL1_004459 [Eukaryota sp. TZLM3-RCL]
MSKKGNEMESFFALGGGTPMETSIAPEAPTSQFSQLTPLLPESFSLDDLPPDESQPVPAEVKVHNVVATVNLGCELDLKHIATYVRNAEFNPRRIAAVVIRIYEPKTTALVFRTGKMVITGSKSEEDCRRASRKFTRMLFKANCPVQLKEFTIHNIVAVTYTPYKIDLEALHVRHHKFSQFEPEIFPGLIYRLLDPKICLLVFMNGKIVLTGGKTREAINAALDKMLPVLAEFKQVSDVPVKK